MRIYGNQIGTGIEFKQFEWFQKNKRIINLKWSGFIFPLYLRDKQSKKKKRKKKRLTSERIDPKKVLQKCCGVTKNYGP